MAKTDSTSGFVLTLQELKALKSRHHEECRLTAGDVSARDRVTGVDRVGRRTDRDRQQNEHLRDTAGGH